MRAKASITVQIVLESETRIGPGKADLLQGVLETGSIAAAGRRLSMSYKRAWYLIDTLNSAFKEPLVTAVKGGRSGGGAHLTATGHAVLAQYRNIEEITRRAVATEIKELANLAKPPGAQSVTE